MSRPSNASAVSEGFTLLATKAAIHSCSWLRRACAGWCERQRPRRPGLLSAASPLSFSSRRRHAGVLCAAPGLHPGRHPAHPVWRLPPAAVHPAARAHHPCACPPGKLASRAPQAGRQESPSCLHAHLLGARLRLRLFSKLLCSSRRPPGWHTRQPGARPRALQRSAALLPSHCALQCAVCRGGPCMVPCAVSLLQSALHCLRCQMPPSPTTITTLHPLTSLLPLSPRASRPSPPWLTRPSCTPGPWGTRSSSPTTRSSALPTPPPSS